MADESQTDNRCLSREFELEQLEGFLQEALDGRRSVCFVTGEAGAGKTALLAEFCRVAHSRHPQLIIADGYCNAQTGIGDPYLPFREIMTELTGEADGPDLAPDSPATKTRKSTRWFNLAAKALIEHGPDLIDIFVPGAAIMTRVGAQAVRSTGFRKKESTKNDVKIVSESDGLEQVHLCEQYTNVLKALAKQHPVLVIIDDLHWSDDASIHLLFHLSRRLGKDRILIIGAYRPEDVAIGRGNGRHPLEGTLNEIKRYYGDATVAVAESDSDGSSFVNAVVDSEPNRLDDGFRAALRRHTNGHALFTVELMRHLQENGKLVKDDAGDWIIATELSWDELPSRIEGIIHQRAARLNEQEEECLSVASVVGDPFSAEVISATTNSERRDIVRVLSGSLATRHSLVQALGIGRIGGIRLSQYEFRHKLFQNYFYQSLDTIQRAHLHEDVGLSLEALFDKNVDAVAIWLARHFAAADDVEKAVNYLLIAAEQSRQAFANAEALIHLEQAQVLLDGDRAADLDEEWLRNSRRRTFRLLGTVYELSCDYEKARSSFNNALSLTPETNRTECAALHRAIAVTWERQSDHGAAIEELQIALRILGKEPDTDQGDWWHEQLANYLGQIWICYWTANIDEMERLITLTEPQMARHGDPYQRRRFCVSIAMLGYRKERYWLSDNTVAAVDKALAVAREAGSLFELADALFGAGFVRLFVGKPTETLEYFKESVQLSRRCGDPRTTGRSLTYLHVAYRQLGNISEVEAMIPEVLTAIKASSAPEYRAVVMANESWLAWKRGDAGLSQTLANNAMEIWHNEAPKYPLKWLAMMQMIAVATKEGQFRDAVSLSQDLLKPPHALLGAGVGDALQQAVDLFAARKEEETAVVLERAVGCAITAGYL